MTVYAIIGVGFLLNQLDFQHVNSFLTQQAQFIEASFKSLQCLCGLNAGNSGHEGVFYSLPVSCNSLFHRCRDELANVATCDRNALFDDAQPPVLLSNLVSHNCEFFCAGKKRREAEPVGGFYRTVVSFSSVSFAI